MFGLVGRSGFEPGTFGLKDPVQLVPDRSMQVSGVRGPSLMALSAPVLQLEVQLAPRRRGGSPCRAYQIIIRPRSGLPSLLAGMKCAASGP